MDREISKEILDQKLEQQQTVSCYPQKSLPISLVEYPTQPNIEDVSLEKIDAKEEGNLEIIHDFNLQY